MCSMKSVSHRIAAIALVRIARQDPGPKGRIILRFCNFQPPKGHCIVLVYMLERFICVAGILEGWANAINTPEKHSGSRCHVYKVGIFHDSYGRPVPLAHYGVPRGAPGRLLGCKGDLAPT